MRVEIKTPCIRNSRKKRKQANSHQAKDKNKQRMWYEKSCKNCGIRTKTNTNEGKKVTCRSCKTIN